MSIFSVEFFVFFAVSVVGFSITSTVHNEKQKSALMTLNEYGSKTGWNKRTHHPFSSFLVPLS